ncbi:pathogenicity-like protein [Xanthomonas arboricola pv. populi]|uniref:Pathogenicity-like protein n=1 Tax=Xanthomonas arboricola pv. populi TaxID=487823 RepID=A0A2S6Z294_9XANT|nr:pathogenicity-like protein [Xanthomonas arboricola]PPT74917.1 pathogenicity-like protein [Xanthomonas arboricola pv. populi]
MRKIFSSQRIETAEGVADLLRNAGIDVRMSNGRSYESKRSGQFSYLEQGNAQAYPTVWIVHADDQPRARDLLRDARLLDTTRRDLPNVEYTFRDGENGSSTSARSWAWRMRLVLLLVIGAVAMFVVLRHRNAPHAATPVAPPAAQPAPATTTAPPAAEDEEVRVRIQPAR